MYGTCNINDILSKTVSRGSVLTTAKISILACITVKTELIHMCPRTAEYHYCECMAEVTNESSKLPKDAGGTHCPDSEAKERHTHWKPLKEVTLAESLKHGRDHSYYCEKDLRVQVQTIQKLYISCWYYNNLSSPEAKCLLKRCRVGTFIIRDSSDPRYLYSISVKTPLGTTSIRVEYSNGRFQLDAKEHLKGKMQKFDSVLQLVDYYVRLGKSEDKKCRLIQSTGKECPVVMSQPRLTSVPTLGHACRISINRALPMTLKVSQMEKCIDELPLPPVLKKYVKDYPYLN